MINAHLYNQIENFHLPGYLEFLYNSRHFNPQIDTDAEFRILCRPNNPNSFNQLLFALYPRYSFYTDGSRSDFDNRVGYAVFSPKLNLKIQKRISNCSIFEAEIFAILHAIEIVLEHSLDKVAVFSDSQYIIKLTEPDSFWSYASPYLKDQRLVIFLLSVQ